MIIELVKTSELILWEKNPRGIKTNDFERLKRQIQKLGYYKPLIVNQDNIVLGGNMRLRALIELGYTEVEVSRVTTRSEKEMLEYNLSDNDAAGYTEEEKLAELVLSLPDIDFSDFKVPMGESVSVESLLNQFRGVVEDEAPPLPENPVSRLGEVYLLGRHRLMCGDSVNLKDVEALMGGKKADMVFTDPPFNLKYTGRGSSKKGSFKKKWKVFEHDDESQDDFVKFMKAFCLSIKEVTAPGGSLYVCIDWRQYPYLNFVMSEHFYVDEMIVWDKTWIKIGGKYRNQHELIAFGLNEDINEHNGYADVHECLLYGANGKQIGKWLGGRRESNIWYLKTDAPTSYQHPTQKPVNLPARAIKNSSFKGDIVLDLFGGSGSTLIACEQLDRVCYMCELDPGYVDVIRRRYANFIGRGNDWAEATPSLS